MSMSTYETCAFEHGNDQQLVLECVVNRLESAAAATEAANTSGDIEASVLKLMLVFAGALIFFMQAGFAMLCAGAVRKKNLNNSMLKNLLDACGGAIAFYALGFGLAFGSTTHADKSTFVGNTNFFLSGDVNSALFFFQLAIASTAVTIVAGTLAERCKMIAYLFYSTVLTGLVYPVVVHAIWSENGLFSSRNSNAVIGSGMVDFGGSGVVHMTGGSTALYATWILGARRGRFHNIDGTLRKTPGLTKGHSTALQMLGTMILWFGWYGFNTGSALVLPATDKASVAATAAVSTALSAATGAISALCTNAFLLQQLQGEFNLDIFKAMNGCLSGLVAITASCGVVTEWAAFVIGIIAGWVYLVGSHLLIKYKIDDAVDAVPVHLLNGIWGVLAAGLFAKPELLLAAYGNDSHPGIFYSFTGPNLLPAQLVGILAILTWTLVTMLPFFIALDCFGLFRVNELEEVAGLDATYVGSAPVETDSESDEDIRLEAYKLRLQQKKDEKKNKMTKAMKKVMNGSWGAASFDNALQGVDSSQDDSNNAAANAEPEADSAVDSVTV